MTNIRFDLADIKPHVEIAIATGSDLRLSNIGGVHLSTAGASDLGLAYAKGLGPREGALAASLLGEAARSWPIPADAFVRAIADGKERVHVHLRPNGVEVEFDPPRPSFLRSERMAAETACGGVSAKAKWAEPGKAYRGGIFGFDSKVVFQRSGRGIVVHEKDLLSWQPQKGQMVTISYPSDPDTRAVVAEGAIRTKSAGLSM